jgi:hypothetical protein
LRVSPVADGTSVTLLIAGEAAPTGSDKSLTVALLVDDTTPAGGAASLRAVNAASSGVTLDFGRGDADAGWVPLLTDVPFASDSADAGASALDPNGYLAIAPLSMEIVSARSSSDSSISVAASVTIGAGSAATLFAIGGASGDTQHPLSLLLCTDSAPVGGPLSDCSIVK